jgi:hypothetical protein
MTPTAGQLLRNKALAGIGVLVLGLAACSADAPTPNEALVAAPTASCTATAPPPMVTTTPTDTATPEVVAEAQELTEKDLEAGHWGAFFFDANAEGSYDAKDSEGASIPDLKLLDDGTAILRYQGKDLTQPFQAITQKEGELVVGLWGYKDGDWSMETHTAPQSSEETKDWRTLVILQGDKEKEMLNTVFLVRDMAMTKAETFDPKEEIKKEADVTLKLQNVYL